MPDTPAPTVAPGPAALPDDLLPLLNTAASWIGHGEWKSNHRRGARVVRRSGIAPTPRATKLAAEGRLGKKGGGSTRSTRVSQTVALSIGYEDLLPEGFAEQFIPAFDAAFRAGLIPIFLKPNGSPSMKNGATRVLVNELRALAITAAEDAAHGVTNTALARRVAGFEVLAQQRIADLEALAQQRIADLENAQVALDEAASAISNLEVCVPAVT